MRRFVVLANAALGAANTGFYIWGDGRWWSLLAGIAGLGVAVLVAVAP